MLARPEEATMGVAAMLAEGRVADERALATREVLRVASAASETEMVPLAAGVVVDMREEATLAAAAVLAKVGGMEAAVRAEARTARKTEVAKEADAMAVAAQLGAV